MKPSVFVPPTRTIYVDKYSPRSGENGSIDHPFRTIQAAIDLAESLNPSYLTDQVIIQIGSGVFNESLLIKGDAITLVGSGRRSTKIKSLGGPALRVSNATKASIAVYHVSGNYADLAAEAVPTSGPMVISIKDLTLESPSEADHATVELLGVVGDESPTTTNFLYGSLGNYGLQLSGVLIAFTDLVANRMMYARNASYIDVNNYSSAGYVNGLFELINCGQFHQRWSLGPNKLTITYDAADPFGRAHNASAKSYYFAYFATTNVDLTMNGLVEATIQQCLANTSADIILNDGSKLVMHDSFIGTINADDTSIVEMHDSYVLGNSDLEAGVTFTAWNSHFKGNLVVAAGAGVVTLKDSRVSGTITDAGSKIVYSKSNVRSGTATGAGAGDVAVAFATALSRTDYKVTLGNIGSGGAVVKPGSKTVNGFTLTFAAAGDCDWSATLGQ